ncbi:hypothetical protein PS726_00213 [Pseudomonas fluorescens]|nr:hypothetical protein PS726_00213 [Pseudomonas fluorescens]
MPIATDTAEFLEELNGGAFAKLTLGTFDPK